MKKFTPHCGKCAFRRSSIFRNISLKSAREIERSAVSNTYKAKQAIFYQNNAPFGIYHIYTGKIKLYKIGQNGRSQIVRMAKSGDILGYRAILAGENYRASAQAIENSTVCFIEKAVFLSILRKDPALCLDTMAMLSRDLRHAEERLTSAIQKSAKQRTAEALCFLADQYGVKQINKINIELSREELGELADTSRETVTRILKQFEDSSLIKIDRRSVRIIKPTEIRKLAGLDD